MSSIPFTRHGLAARVTLELCPKLPTGSQTVEIPAPGVPFRCPRPCGSGVCIMCPVAGLLADVEQPAEPERLNLRATQLELLSAGPVAEAPLTVAHLRAFSDVATMTYAVHRN